ncbi:MAG: hypothetical protein QOH25_2225 [Acidobacteriota bacterium]|jgi:hypothetical protein|nr:hypothetical protein [Acidobacteriota bacterium]
MATPPLAVNQLSLAPLGAGDLIDRAVRLYRRHFMTLIRIAAPPVVISATGSVMMTVASRTPAPLLTGGDVLMLIFGLLLWAGGVLLNVIVMGGAARNLITHLLWHEPFSARTTYRNARARFWGLLGAAIIIAIWIGIAFFISVLVWAFVIQLFAVAGIAGGRSVSWLVSTILFLAILFVTFLALLLFFLMVKFIAYVPQVMMIEGRGVFDSIGRSFTLARGNLRRLMAMFLFYWFATWSALMILIIPLLWYGSLQGVNILPTKAITWPMWYAVGYSVITQASAILLAPVWMLGLSLMYVDERVRQEGYDIELIAARQLGAAPNAYGAQNIPDAVGVVAQPHGYTTTQPQSQTPGSMPGFR